LDKGRSLLIGRLPSIALTPSRASLAAALPPSGRGSVGVAASRTNPVCNLHSPEPATARSHCSASAAQNQQPFKFGGQLKGARTLQLSPTDKATPQHT